MITKNLQKSPIFFLAKNVEIFINIIVDYLDIKKIVIKNLSEKGDLLEAAANLFKLLWEFDNEKIKNIAVMKVPNQGLGIAINDRLLRASK